MPSQLPVGWTSRRIFVAAFLLVLAAKWQVVTQPPVWDSSKSVFPAAITLAHTGFDLVHLLEQPGYFHGGPNTHSLSLVTWLTAVAYWALGDRPQVILPLLHVVHYLATAVALTLLWRIASRAMDSRFALATVAVIAVFPLFFVQAGYLYLEMPILAFAAAALDAWQRGRPGQAAAFAVGCILIKPSGAVVTGALVLCALAGPGRWRRRVVTSCWLAAGPLAVAVAQFVLRTGGTRRSLGRLDATLVGLKSVPDLALVLALFALGTLVVRPWRPAVHLTTDEGPGGDGATSRPAGGRADRRAEAHLICLAMFVAFFGFYLALLPLGTSVILLPRYYLQLFPFAIIGLVAMLVAASRRLAAGLLVVLGIFFLANREGHFYPDRGSGNFAITERSMAYLDLVELQDLGLERLLEAGAEDPVFYGLSESFRLGYPEMGHGASKPPRGHCIYNEFPYHRGRLEDFPPSFYVLYDYPWLGGEVTLRVLRQAEEHPAFEVRAVRLSVGPFESHLARVWRRDADQPPAAEPDAVPTENTAEAETLR